MTSFDEPAILMPLDEYYEHYVDPKPKIPKRYGFAKKQRKAAHLQSYKDGADDEDDDDEDEYEEEERKQVDEFSSSIDESNQTQIDFETNDFNLLYEDTDDPMGQNDKKLNKEMPANSAQWRIQPNNVNRPQGAPPLVSKNARRNNFEMHQKRSRFNRPWSYRNRNNNNNNRNNSRVSVHNRLGYNMKHNWQRGQQHQRNPLNALNTKQQVNNTRNDNNNQPPKQHQVIRNTQNQIITNQQPNNNNNHHQLLQQLLMKIDNQLKNKNQQNNIMSNNHNNRQQHQEQQVLMNLNDNHIQNGNSHLNVTSPLVSIETQNSNFNRRNNDALVQSNGYQNITKNDTISTLISLANNLCNNQDNKGDAYNTQAQVMPQNNYPAQNRLGPVTRVCSNQSALVNAGYAQYQPNPINQTNRLQRVNSGPGAVVASERVRLADLMDMPRNDDAILNLREVAANAILLLSKVVHTPMLNKDVQQVLSNLQQNNGLSENPTGLNMSINPQATDMPMSHRFM